MNTFGDLSLKKTLKKTAFIINRGYVEAYRDS